MKKLPQPRPSAVDIFFDRGIHLPALDLWMDSLRGRPGCWVSHGHTDHIAAHRHFLATGPTADFLRLRHPKSRPITVGYDEPVEGSGYRMTLHPAGHCLGAAQLLVELESTGRRIVYTGDLKLRSNPTSPPAPVLPCDTLVIEATFGHPHYVFPPQEQVLDDLTRFIDGCFHRGETPVVLAYILGKSQEVLHHLLERGLRVRYERRIGEVVRLYERWGAVFQGDHADAEEGDLAHSVVIMPPGSRRSPLFRSLVRPRTALMTGWALDEGARFRVRADAAFPFSDHADYSELLRYVEESGAKQVYTVNGMPHLAHHLSAMGIAAQHLDGKAAPPPSRQLSLPF